MKFAHTNIAAKDWRVLTEFYISVFNCSIKPPERNLSGQWLNNATGLTNAKLSGVHLLLPGYDDNGPILEIFTYEDTHETTPIMANFVGFTHIAFEVNDVEQIFNLAMSNGGKVLGRITEKVVENIGVLKFVYFRDPEDNIVEIQSWAK